MRDITISVKPEINKFKNYFYKLAKENSNVDLTDFLEDKGVDTSQYNVLFFPMNDNKNLLYIQANSFNETTGRFCNFKAHINDIPC